MCQGFSHFSFFLHHFVTAKLATSSIRVKVKCLINPDDICREPLKYDWVKVAIGGGF